MTVSFAHIETLHMTPDYATMRCGPFCVIIWRGDGHLSAISHFTQVTLERLRERPRGVALVAVIEDSATVPDATTRALSAAANDRLAEAGVVAIAGIVPKEGFFGACFRGVATALHRLSLKRYPLQVYANAADACKWSASYLPEAVDWQGYAEVIDQFRARYEQTWKELRRSA